MSRRAVFLLALGLPVAAVGCGGDDGGTTSSTDSRDAQVLSAAVAFYPIEEVVRSVGGDAVEVVGLTPPGGGPHDLELTPETAAALERADVVFYIGRGFQPSVEKAVSALPDEVRTIDLLDSVQLLPVTPQLDGTEGEVDGEVLSGNADPHVWVDPVNMVTLTDVVAATLSEASPPDKATFDAGAQAYAAMLQSLSDEFETQLATCESRTIVTSHRAFEYLAQRYDLKQIPIAGLSPDEEPDPKSLEAIAEAAKADDVTVVFFEERVPTALSDTVAREIGASTDALDPIETITQDRLDAGESYLTIQAANLASLVKALRCT
jgi:zinc transport system substrate-binding protein